MTNRQTLPDLLARLTEDRHTAEVDSLRRVIAEERARADRLLTESSQLREILDDAIESLELLVPVPATKPAADTIAPQSILTELNRRDMYTHPTGAPVTAAAAWAALRTVLDGVEAVLGRVADAGGPVVVPVGLVADPDGFFPHDGTAFPPCAPGDEVEVRLRRGDTYATLAGSLVWRRAGDGGDIIAWRPVRKGGPDKRDI